MAVRNLSPCPQVFNGTQRPMLQEAGSLHQKYRVDTRLVKNKGRLWKNTDDGILKAVFKKNEKDEWQRVVSLLVEKFPKQQNARCLHRLEPSIKKMEWTPNYERARVACGRMPKMRSSRPPSRGTARTNGRTCRESLRSYTRPNPSTI